MGFSDKSYKVLNGRVETVFFCESEPDRDGFCRGNIANLGPEDYCGQVITEVEQVSYHTEDLTDEIKGVVWPEGVTN